MEEIKLSLCAINMIRYLWKIYRFISPNTEFCRNGIMQCVNACVGFLPTMMVLRLIHVVACTSRLFLLVSQFVV